jgi:tripartite-type tricarboxylate transporter receptor subunit TctC
MMTPAPPRFKAPLIGAAQGLVRRWPGRRLRRQWAQSAWPNKPIRVVVPYGAGSSPDVIMRIVGERSGAPLGQPVVVENRAGAGGNTGTGAVAKSAGDGYTYVISTNGPLVYNTQLYSKLGYDPFTELRPWCSPAARPMCARCAPTPASTRSRTWSRP